MNKIMLPALIVFGLLAACSGSADAPKDGAVAETKAPAADDDNDTAAPTPAKAEDDHPHAEGEAEHKH